MYLQKDRSQIKSNQSEVKFETQSQEQAKTSQEQATASINASQGQQQAKIASQGQTASTNSTQATASTNSKPTATAKHNRKPRASQEQVNASHSIRWRTKIKTNRLHNLFTQSLQHSRFKISTFRIGRSVMERLLDASTCWHGRTQRAAGNTIPEDRERLVTNTFIIKHRNRTHNTTFKTQCSKEGNTSRIWMIKVLNQPSSCVKSVSILIHIPTSISPQHIQLRSSVRAA